MFTRFQRGERLGAGKLNDMLAEIEDHTRVSTDGSISVHQGPAGIALAAKPAAAGELFLNTSGTTIPAYGLIAVTGIDGTSLDPILQCSPIGSTFTTDLAVNGDEDIPSGQFGLCRREGPVRVALGSSVTFAAGDGFGPQPSSFFPAIGFPQCLALDGWYDETNFIAYGLLRKIDTLIGQAGSGSAIGSKSSGSLNIYAGTPGSETPVSGWSVTVYNYGSSLSPGTFAEAFLIDGKWYLSPQTSLEVVSPYGGSGASVGDAVQALTGCLYPGKMLPTKFPDDGASGYFCTNKPFDTGVNCYLFVIDYPMGPAGKPLHHGDQYVGKLTGTWTIDGNKYPVYEIRDGDQQEIVTPYDSPSTSLGAAVPVNVTTGLVPGKSLTWGAVSPDYTTAAYRNSYDCQIYVMDNPGGAATAGLSLPFGQRYLGRYVGNAAGNLPVFAVTSKGSQLVRFELYTDLVFGVGSASAKIVKWDGSAWSVTSTVITVYDPFIAGGSDFSGKAPSTGMTVGYRGWCTKMSDSGRYEIVYMEHQAQWIKGTLASALASTDASQASCLVTDYWQGRNPDPAAAGVTIYNEGEFFGPESAVFYATWDDNDSKYNIVWVQPVAHWIEGLLTADVASGAAAASVLDFHLGLNPDPTNAGITVRDPQNLFKRALDGADFVALYDEHDEYYEIIEAQSKAGQIYFKLSGAISSGSATASLVNSSGQAGAYGTQQDTQAPTGTLTVKDPGGSAGIFQFCPANALGSAIFDNVNNTYWIATCQYYARWVSGTITTLTSSVGATTTLTVVKHHDGVDPGASVTATDTDGIWGTISSTTQCKAYYNPDDGKYYLLWVKC